MRGINLGNWLLPEGYMFKLEVATAHWQIQQVIMDSASCIRTLACPPYWDEIIEFAKVHHADPADIKKHRPPLEHSRAALAGLLANVKFENNHINQGYITALVSKE